MRAARRRARCRSPPNYSRRRLPKSPRSSPNCSASVISTLWGEVEVKALVTERVRPFRLAGQTVHEVGLVWHFGWEGFAWGDIANILSAVVGDPNTSIHEAKAFTCNLRRGRRNQVLAP